MSSNQTKLGIDIGNPLASLQNHDKIDNSPFAGLLLRDIGSSIKLKYLLLTRFSEKAVLPTGEYDQKIPITHCRACVASFRG